MVRLPFDDEIAAVEWLMAGGEPILFDAALFARREGEVPRALCRGL